MISRYYNQRQQQVKSSSSHSTIANNTAAAAASGRLTSTSCEHFPSTSSTTIVNERTPIIKTSYSWPEANMLAREDQEQIQSSSSTPMEQPTSLTFSLRWDEKIKSLFVRVISARDLFSQNSSRQPLIIDSYVRIELLSTNDQTHPPSKIFFRS